MISEVDINDWEMLTEPLELNDIKLFDLFSIPGSLEIYKHYGDYADKVKAANINCVNAFDDVLILPKYLKVNLWLKK